MSSRFLSLKEVLTSYKCGGCICKVKYLKKYPEGVDRLFTGTREDLWNTVPPKMAQRIFSGMLNETLSILTVRYGQVGIK